MRLLKYMKPGKIALFETLDKLPDGAWAYKGSKVIERGLNYIGASGDDIFDEISKNGLIIRSVK